MQALPGDILQHIADRLPGRNARRMGMTFSGARTAVARSLAARRPLDRKKERAALTLAKRNRDVMAVVTRLIHGMHTKSTADARATIQHGVAWGKLSLRSWCGRIYWSMVICVRVLTSKTRVRGSFVRVEYILDKDPPHTKLMSHYMLGGNQLAAEKRLAIRGITTAVGIALRANGYEAEISRS